MVLVYYGGNARDETQVAFPMELLASAPYLVKSIVVYLSELGKNGLTLFAMHLQDRGKVLQGQNLVR